MRRFALCLMVYVVVKSTANYETRWSIKADTSSLAIMSCSGYPCCEDWMKDYAESLNAAHERLHPTPHSTDEMMPHWMMVDPSRDQEITYPKACEPDGCGRDPR